MHNRIRLFPVHGPDAEGLHLVVHPLGFAGNAHRFAEQLARGAPVEGQDLPLLTQPVRVGEARGMDAPVDGEIRLMPQVGRGKAKAESRDEQMLDFIMWKKRTGTGIDLLAAGKRPRTDFREQQAGGSAPVVSMEYMRGHSACSVS